MMKYDPESPVAVYQMRNTAVYNTVKQDFATLEMYHRCSHFILHQIMWKRHQLSNVPAMCTCTGLAFFAE